MTPLVTEAGNENRLTGYPGLPIDLNPYRRTYENPRLIAGAVLPAPGAYDIVLETTGKGGPGAVHDPLVAERHRAAEAAPAPDARR